jgi:predicted GNAT family N-acyltransferase
MEIKLIRHENISAPTLNQICELKSLHWHFPIEKQLAWIEANIQKNDYHLLIIEDSQLVAYMNLVDINVEIDDHTEAFKGIGNVCTRSSGKGLGNILMDAVNQALIKYEWHGILLCKDPLVGYYKKNHWALVEKAKVEQEKYKEINIMVFNYKMPIKHLRYDGRNF